MANFIDQNGIEDFIDDNGVTLFVDNNGVFLGLGGVTPSGNFVVFTTVMSYLLVFALTAMGP